MSIILRDGTNPSNLAEVDSSGNLHVAGVVSISEGTPSPVDSELGSASRYALLAAAGITNTGNTVVNGGVIGSYPTATETGFPPGIATVDNADAALAQANALTAYNFYSALAFTSLSGSSANLSVLGNGSSASTYTAGNYSAGSSMDIPTSITLDAQGNPDAVFVFKAGSTVTLESGASVLLVNGAIANNVIWIVGSSATTVATGTMTGTILANTSITLGGGTLNGRALAGIVTSSGTVTIAAATQVNTPASLLTPLSVDVLNFPVTQQVTGTVSATQGTSPWVVSGTVSASNPSVGATGAAVPADATMVGGSDGTDLRALLTDATGQLKVLVENTVPVTGTFFQATQPVSGTVTAVQPTGANLHVDVDNFPATQPVSGTVAATQSTSPWVVDGQLTHNNAAPIADNVGVLPAVASSAAPTYNAGDQVLLSTDLAGNLRTTATATVSGSVTANQGTPNTVANSWPVEVTDGTNILGTPTHPVRVDPTGTTTQPVSGSVSVSNFPVTQPVSGTVVAEIEGHAGATLDSAAGTPNTQAVTIQGNASGVAVPVSGTFFQATQPVSGTVTANQGTSPWVTSDNNAVAQGSTTSGEKGFLGLGAVTTAAPTYTTGQSDPLSLTTAGALRVDGSGVTQPVSGTVTTTPPANASTNITQVGGSALSEGQKTSAASVPVVIASDQSAIPVTLTSTTITGTVAENLTQVAGTTLGATAVTNFGTAPAAAAVPGVNSSLFAGVTGITATGSSLNVDVTNTVPVTLTSTTITGTVTVAGSKTNNNAAPGATNLGVLPGIANAATQTWTEGDQVLESMDLSGRQRIRGTLTHNNAAPSSDGNMALVCIANAAAPTYTEGDLVLASTDLSGNLRTSPTTSSGTLTNNNAAPTTNNVGVLPAIAETAYATVTYTTGNQVLPVVDLHGAANTDLQAIAGTAVVTAQAGSQKVGISGATGATLDAVVGAATAPTNGLATLGVYGSTASPTLSSGQSIAVQMDGAGDVFVRPFRRSQVKAQATTISATSSATTVVTAPPASVFADITSLVVTATPGATGTAFTITLSDGTANYIFDMDTGSTTTLVQNGILNLAFNPPLPATSAATAWTIANSSATPTIHVTVVSVQGKAN